MSFSQKPFKKRQLKIKNPAPAGDPPLMWLMGSAEFMSDMTRVFGHVRRIRTWDYVPKAEEVMVVVIDRLPSFAHDISEQKRKEQIKQIVGAHGLSCLLYVVSKYSANKFRVERSMIFESNLAEQHIG